MVNKWSGGGGGDCDDGEIVNRSTLFFSFSVPMLGFGNRNWNWKNKIRFTEEEGTLVQVFQFLLADFQAFFLV